MKPTKILIFTVLLGSLILGACGGAADQNGNSAEVLTEAAQIAFQALTETAAAASPTPSPSATATNTPLPPTATPTLEGTQPTSTSIPTQQLSSGGNSGKGTGCLRAELSYETPQDGAKFALGEIFTKTWEFKNVGSCPWTAGFSLVFIQGDLMGAKTTIAFSDFIKTDIATGDHITLKVNFVTPSPQGTYKGYWMLRSDQGIFFGLGPDGKAWFWVEVFAKH